MRQPEECFYQTQRIVQHQRALRKWSHIHRFSISLMLGLSFMPFTARFIDRVACSVCGCLGVFWQVHAAREEKALFIQFTTSGQLLVVSEE